MLRIVFSVMAVASAVTFVVTHPTSAEIADLSAPSEAVAMR